jgi:hypothetical protein
MMFRKYERRFTWQYLPFVLFTLIVCWLRYGAMAVVITIAATFLVGIAISHPRPK